MGTEAPAGEAVDVGTGELHPDETAVLEGLAPDELDSSAAAEREPEREPEPKRSTSEKELERLYGQLDKASSAYIGKVSALLEGHDTGLDTCPLCAYPGLVFPYGGDSSDDVVKRQLTEAYFGLTQDELQPDPAYVICDACKGQGFRVTPSKVPGNRKIMCTVCAGQGHREVAQLQAQAQVSNVTPMIQPSGDGAWQTLPTLDSWGRPPGHPHYGIEPAAVGLTG